MARAWFAIAVALVVVAGGVASSRAQRVVGDRCDLRIQWAARTWDDEAQDWILAQLAGANSCFQPAEIQFRWAENRDRSDLSREDSAYLLVAEAGDDAIDVFVMEHVVFEEGREGWGATRAPHEPGERGVVLLSRAAASLALAHELGHYLGLDDEPLDSANLMYPIIVPTGRALSASQLRTVESSAGLANCRRVAAEVSRHDASHAPTMDAPPRGSRTATL